eukprot:CAMPEP_0172720996 /NCGR_PEP_ID=MMETSP1074-20121228/78129_1 /TAXON_ID=2916 /ORGANISM="Ceratium fusus, Strain PA161109" /LENGTH=201 /DNA_ID=CAMNT_0013546627 /DNA_START=170 /DNA_END=775 /DNA_ORIENTATION=+
MSKCSGGTNASMSGEFPEGVGLSHLKDGIDSNFLASSQGSWSMSSEVTSSKVGSEATQPSDAVGDVMEGLNAMNMDSSGNLVSTEGLDPSLPSNGARLHEAGACQPCLFNISGNCAAGRSCVFCHMHHNSAQKKSAKDQRPSKKVRDRRQRRAVQDLSEAADDSSHAPLPPGRVIPLTPGPLSAGPAAPRVANRQRNLVHL